MHQRAARTGTDQFTYRGITATRSADGFKLPRWTAEIQRQRAYEFVRAETAEGMTRKIDEALARRPAG